MESGSDRAAAGAGQPSYRELWELVRRLQARIAEQDVWIEQAQAERIAEQDAMIAAQSARIAEQEALIAELRARVGRDSTNSGQPPSGDGYEKPPPEPRNLRKRSGRKAGGQKGSPGHHLRRRESADESIALPAGSCSGCGGDLAGAPVVGSEERQVLDLPEMPDLRCVSYVAERRLCECGRESCPAFPAGVSAPVQYGPRVRALGIYLVCYQHLPYARAAQLMADWLRVTVSVGSLHAFVAAGESGLEGFLAQLREQLTGAELLHADETGMRTEGSLWWVHSASTPTLTHYHAHQRRGREGADQAGILARFLGIMVHDGWKPYQGYTQADHALCGVHHLRELLAAEQAGQRWAGAMTLMLEDACHTVNLARQDGASALPASVLGDLTGWYEQIIHEGLVENPGVSAGKRRKRTDAQNLLLRLHGQQTEVLRFINDLTVPFSNNLAERDLRMVKIHQKISGCFRAASGLHSFLAIRSYLSTGRKQHQDPMPLLTALTAGRAWLPPPLPT